MWNKKPAEENKWHTNQYINPLLENIYNFIIYKFAIKEFMLESHLCEIA